MPSDKGNRRNGRYKPINRQPVNSKGGNQFEKIFERGLKNGF